MACEVRYTNPKTGLTYAYSSEAKWNPEKGYSVPVRTYLGRVNPETNEIIPTSHKRGRKKKTESVDAPSYLAQYETTLQDLRAVQADVVNLKREIHELRIQKEKMNKVLTQVYHEIGTILTDSSS